jgi:AcrR family transcriptional regulator
VTDLRPVVPGEDPRGVAPDSTTDRILAATSLVYAEAGFRGTTTRRIAQEAGVNEITLFRQFGTKEALVKTALSRSYQEISPVILAEPADPPAELHAWATATYRHWYSGRHLISKVLGDLVEHPELSPDICDEPGSKHAMLSLYLGRMRERGMATSDFIPDAAAGMLLGSLFTHAIWRDHFATPDLPPAEDIIGAYVHLLLASVGFAAESGRAPKESS